MIAVIVQTTVDADAEETWRALSDRVALAVWAPHRLAFLDPETPYPVPGRTVRWQCRIGRLPLVLSERPLVVEPRRRLHSAMALGAFRFESDWRLLPAGAQRTRVGLRLSAAGEVVLVSGTLDRFEVRRRATALARESLEALTAWCARPPTRPEPAPAPRRPEPLPLFPR